MQRCFTAQHPLLPTLQWCRAPPPSPPMPSAGGALGTRSCTSIGGCARHTSALVVVHQILRVSSPWASLHTFTCPHTSAAGVLHFHGQGTPVNYTAARLYFEQAADRDHDAAYNLGTVYQVWAGGSAGSISPNCALVSVLAGMLRYNPTSSTLSPGPPVSTGRLWCAGRHQPGRPAVPQCNRPGLLARTACTHAGKWAGARAAVSVACLSCHCCGPRLACLGCNRCMAAARSVATPACKVRPTLHAALASSRRRSWRTGCMARKRTFRARRVPFGGSWR